MENEQPLDYRRRNSLKTSNKLLGKKCGFCVNTENTHFFHQIFYTLGVSYFFMSLFVVYSIRFWFGCFAFNYKKKTVNQHKKNGEKNRELFCLVALFTFFLPLALSFDLFSHFFRSWSAVVRRRRFRVCFFDSFFRFNCRWGEEKKIIRSLYIGTCQKHYFFSHLIRFVLSSIKIKRQKKAHRSHSLHLGNERHRNCIKMKKNRTNRFIYYKMNFE